MQLKSWKKVWSKEENEKQVNDEEKVRAIKQTLEKNAEARNAEARNVKLAVKRKAKNPIKIKREGGGETKYNNILTTLKHNNLLFFMSIFNQDIYKNYYNSEEASKPFKSCIHICHCIQFPDRVWKNIKEFIVMTKRQGIICKSIYKKGYYIDLGQLIIKQKFNNYAYKTKKKGGYLRIYDKFTDMGDFGNNLKINERLKTLIIKNSFINVCENSSLFYDALKINTRLTKLSLNGCSINNLDNLVEALKINKNINYLSLEDNMIRNIEGMSNMLKTNTTLHYVSFKDNYITSIKTLCEALKTNETLTRLNL